MISLFDPLLGAILVSKESLDELAVFTREVALDGDGLLLDEANGFLDGNNLHILQLGLVHSLLKSQVFLQNLVKVFLEGGIVTLECLDHAVVHCATAEARRQR